jgi:hypothetical protein
MKETGNPQLSRKTTIFIVAAFTLGIVVSGFMFGLTFYASKTDFLGSAMPFTAEFGRYVFEEMAAEAASAYTAREASSSQLDLVSRMMVYTARLGLEVSDVDSAIDSIYTIARDLQGDVSGISTSREGGRKIGAVTVRVPQEDFYTAIEAIENLGRVDSKDVKGEDVTEEYVDLSARLRNLQNQEQRLAEILSMATTVEDVLRVESELNKVRLEIEQITGKIQYLENRVELATITVLLGESPPWIALPEIDWGKPIEAGLWGLFTVFQGLIAISIIATPFIAVGTPIYYFYRRRQTESKGSQ